MPLHLIRADLTRFPCDAVVISSDESLRGGSMMGAAVSAVSLTFLDTLRRIGTLPAGSARHLKGVQFQCRHTIITAAPIWRGGGHHEIEQLTACYRNSLSLAQKLHSRRVAVGLIDSRAYGIPQDIALDTAITAITDFLEQHNLEVYLTSFDLKAYAESAEREKRLDAFVRERYAAAPSGFSARLGAVSGKAASRERVQVEPSAQVCYQKAPDLESALKMLDESFTEMLLRKIDERGMTDAECYKRANIDRRLFSKIRSDRHYHPKKSTAVAFAVALELSLSETQELLHKAGYSLSHSSKSDIIIEFFIREGNYNVFDINEALYEYDQKLLGTE